MIQLILHLIGDYVTQSDWMANNKTKASFPAFCHALVYSLPFLFIGSWLAVLVIFATHFAIDRWRLAVYVVWLKNVVLGEGVMFIACITMPQERFHREMDRIMRSKELNWENCKATGYPSDRPAWMAVWLLIAADNTIHLAINYAALLWL